MRRAFMLFALVALTLAILAPVRAQGDGFGAEEQAALESARMALRDFAELESVSATVTQHMTQQIDFAMGGDALRFVQEVEATGQQRLERTAGARFPNQHLMLAQQITSTLAQGGTSDTELVRLDVVLLVADDRIYLKLDAPDVAGAFPAGWHDVTDGASMFPGMSLFDLDGTLRYGMLAGADVQEAALGQTLVVEILEPEQSGDRRLTRTRLTLDPAAILAVMGTDGLAAMFDAHALQLDLDVFAEQLFGAEGAQYQLELTIDPATGQLIELAETFTTEADVSPAFPAELDLQVSVMQVLRHSLRIDDTNTPIHIEAPPLDG